MPIYFNILKELPGKYPAASLVKSTILGLAHLLRRALALPEIK